MSASQRWPASPPGPSEWERVAPSAIVATTAPDHRRSPRPKSTSDPPSTTDGPPPGSFPRLVPSSRLTACGYSRMSRPPRRRGNATAAAAPLRHTSCSISTSFPGAAAANARLAGYRVPGCRRLRRATTSSVHSNPRRRRHRAALRLEPPPGTSPGIDEPDARGTRAQFHTHSPSGDAMDSSVAWANDLVTSGRSRSRSRGSPRDDRHERLDVGALLEGEHRRGVASAQAMIGRGDREHLAGVGQHHRRAHPLRVGALGSQSPNAAQPSTPRSSSPSCTRPSA